MSASQMKHSQQHPDAQDEYVMFPRPKLSIREIDETDSAIRRIVGPDVAIEKATADEGRMLLFWLGPLSEDQIAEVGKLEGVSIAISQPLKGDQRTRECED